MPIVIGARGASLPGQTFAPYTYVDWLAPDKEALLVQGGDANYSPARTLSPAESSLVRDLVAPTRNQSLRAALLASASVRTLDVANRSSSSTDSNVFAGNGTTQDVLTRDGFTPDLVILKTDSAQEAMIWTRAGWYGRSDALTNLDSTGGGVTPIEGGFRVGSSPRCNAAGVNTYWFAYADNGSGSFLTSSHQGNAVAGRVLHTFDGLPIKAVGVKRDSSAGPVFAFLGAANSASYAGVLGTDVVIGGDGSLTLSGASTVNQWSANLGEGTVVWAIPDDASDSFAFMFTGSGVGRRVQLPYLPEFLLIQPFGNSTASGQMWFSALAAGQHATTGPAAIGVGRITSVDGSAISITNASQINANSVPFLVIGFRRNRNVAALRRNPKLAYNKAVQIATGGYIDCGTSDTLMFSGAGSWEWLGSIYPASTTAFAGGAGVDNEVNKQYPLFCRSSGADGASGAVSWALEGMCPRPEGVGATGGDWDGVSICWATYDKWALPQSGTPNLDDFPAYSGIVLPSGEIHHIVLTHDGAGFWKLFVDGKLVKVRERNLTAVGHQNAPGFSGHRTVIGARRRGSGANEFGHAHQVRLVRVYSRALTDLECVNQFAAVYGLASAATDFVEEWDMRNASGTSVPATRYAANNGTITGGVVI